MKNSLRLLGLSELPTCPNIQGWYLYMPSVDVEIYHATIFLNLPKIPFLTMLPRGSATSTGILLGTVEANETSLLSPPEDCQVPEGIRPTFFQAQKHPKESEIVEQVNQFFLEHWPFKTDEHARRFVDEGYAWFACINCPLSLDDRLH